jgi:hypothetical protein
MIGGSVDIGSYYMRSSANFSVWVSNLLGLICRGVPTIVPTDSVLKDDFIMLARTTRVLIIRCFKITENNRESEKWPILRENVLLYGMLWTVPWRPGNFTTNKLKKTSIVSRNPMLVL